VQKIFTSPAFLSFAVHFPGRTRYFVLGRGKNAVGIWEGKSNIPSDLRTSDRLLEYCRHHFQSSRFLKFVYFSEKIPLLIPFFKGELKHYLMISWADRRLYFAHCQQLDEGRYSCFLPFLGERKEINAKEDELLSEMEKLFPTEFLKEQQNNSNVKELLEDECQFVARHLQKGESRQKKRLSKKKEKIEKDLEQIREWKSLQQQCFVWQIDPSPLRSLQKLEHRGIIVKFKKEMSEFQKLDKVFIKVKGLKIAESIQENRLRELEKSIENLGDQQLEWGRETLKSLVTKVLWSENFKKENTAVTKSSSIMADYFDLKIGVSTFKIAIGKNAQANDQLRSHWASKNDWWLHLEQGTSAHLFAKQLTGMLDVESLSFLASALAEYSGVKNSGTVAIIYTQVKNLKGVKSQPGKVIFKKEKHVVIKIDLDWCKKTN